FTTWPFDFHLVHSGFAAEAEMQAGIVLREVTASGANFVELHQLSCSYCHPCADGHFIALCANQFEQHAMIFVSSLIQKQRGRFAGIHDHDVDVSIVVEVAERGSST